MTSAIHVVISQNSKLIILQYLRAFAKFSQILNINISPTSDLNFSAVNENQSCFASLKIQASALNRQASNYDPSDEIFTLNYRQPIKPLIFHLQAITSKSTQNILLEFTHVAVNFIHFYDGFDVESGFKGSWRGLLSPKTIENPIVPPLESFPTKIYGFSSEWFNYLLEAVGGSSSSGSKMYSGLKSTLILKTSSSSGLKLLFPGKNEAEIDIPPFNFASFHASISVAIVVSLREFSALMSVAKKQKIDLFFGPPGHPLVASIRDSNGIFESKFVMATISLDSHVIPEIQDEQEHVSGTEDEVEDD